MNVVSRWSLVVGFLLVAVGLGERPTTTGQRRFSCTNAGLDGPACGSSRNLSRRLAPRHHLYRRPTVHVGLVEYDVGTHMCWPGGQHLLLAVDQVAGIEG